MKNFFLAVLVLICVSLAAFLPGLAWGHYSARRTVASNDKIAELVLSKAHVRYRTFTFACDGRDYEYGDSTGASTTAANSQDVPFFDNYDQALNYSLFGNGILISNAAMMGRGVSKLPEKQQIWLIAGSVAAATWGFSKGYQMGFERSLDCSKIADSLNAGLWKDVSAQLEKQAAATSPIHLLPTLQTEPVRFTPVLPSVPAMTLADARTEVDCLGKLPPSADVAVCSPPNAFSSLVIRRPRLRTSTPLEVMYPLGAANATR